MGSAIGIARGPDGRNKTIVTQLRQENVRLQARIDRLSVEATRLKAEINVILKEKEQETCNINGGHVERFSSTNTSETGTSEQETSITPASYTEKVLELDTLKIAETQEPTNKQDEVKTKHAGKVICTERGNMVVCSVKKNAEK